jgi:integrase
MSSAGSPAPTSPAGIPTRTRRAPKTDITEDQIESLVRDLARKGKTKRTISKMLGTLRAGFQFATRKNVLRVNPAQDVEPLGKSARVRDALTVAELEALRRAIVGDPLEACWMLTLAGLRRSELLGLHWSDFDATPGELTIRRGRGIIGGEQDPKTSQGARVLPLDSERIDLLKDLHAQQVVSPAVGPFAVAQQSEPTGHPQD